MRKGSATRERILEIAVASVLAKGFGATSIEELIVEAGLTKSGFFYHFKDKKDLALGLLERHARQTERLLASTFGRAAELSEDPLQAFLIGLRLLSEQMATLPGGHPGCIVAAMSYQDRLFDQEVRAVAARSTSDLAAYFRAALERIVAVYPLREPVDLDQLARMVCCIIDGGIVIDKTWGGAGVLPEQLLLLRTHIKLLFQPMAANQVAPAKALAA
jgi:TetR/AcrR family transcriptional regulator, transcriptional repressor for nem operon